MAQGSAASLAFDLDVQSALLGTASDGEVVTRDLSTPQTGGSVIVLGTAAGVVEVETDEGWVEVGTTVADEVWHQFGVADDVEFGAVRIVLAAGDVALTELVASSLVVDSEPDPTEEPTPMATTTVTATASTTVTATASTTVTATASTTATQTVVATVTPTRTVTVRPTETVTTQPTRPGPTVNPGAHLPYPARVYQVPGLHNYNGRQWRTECDTAATGNGACRSYIWATVVDADPPAGFRMTDKWVFNNIVLFD